MDHQELIIAEAIPCPFCEGKAIWSRDPGSYGYRPARLAIACENQPYLDPYRNLMDRRTKKCFAITGYMDTERWEPGKGTFDITPEVRKALLEQWNTRAPKVIGELAWWLVFEKLGKRNDEIVQLRTTLKLCREQFAFYTKEHFNKAENPAAHYKDAENSRKKAATNLEFVDLCDSALGE